MSTLFFILFSGIFAQSMITISGNQMIQYNQLIASYQARAALNMSKAKLYEQIEQEGYPKSGIIKTSQGEIEIVSQESAEEIKYTLTITTTNGYEYSDEIEFNPSF